MGGLGAHGREAVLTGVRLGEDSAGLASPR